MPTSVCKHILRMVTICAYRAGILNFKIWHICRLVKAAKTRDHYVKKRAHLYRAEFALLSQKKMGRSFLNTALQSASEQYKILVYLSSSAAKQHNSRSPNHFLPFNAV